MAAFWLDRAVRWPVGRHDRKPGRLRPDGRLRGPSRIKVPGDALAWIHGCEILDHRLLTDLVAAGAGAGWPSCCASAAAACPGERSGVMRPAVPPTAGRGPIHRLAGRCGAWCARGGFPAADRR